MDSRHVDALARVLSTTDSRRRVLALLATLPVLGGLLGILGVVEADAKGRRKRRKKAHKHGKGRRRKHQHTKKTPQCVPNSLAQTCAGKCGSVTNTCQHAVDCGACACVADCAGKTCGPDGCGGACGACSGTAPFCDGTICVPCSADNPCPGGCCQSDGACGATCQVFLTSTTHQGGFGGLAGGDAICQARASAAGLPGKFMAWLSDDTNSPGTRFPLAGSASVGPYTLTGLPLAQVADTWADLTTCDSGVCIDHTISRDETGADAGSSDPLVWTGTLTNGTHDSGYGACEQWTTSVPDPLIGGLQGRWNLTDASWTFSGLQICSDDLHLYCFQQG